MISSYYVMIGCVKLTLHNSKYCHSEDLHDLDVLTNDYMPFSPSQISVKHVRKLPVNITVHRRLQYPQRNICDLC